MKKLLLFLALCCIPVLETGCQTPNQRVMAVPTLKVVGESAESAVAMSAQLYADRAITPAQARQVMDYYDSAFQPAFRLAVTAAHSDLTSLASPELLSMANQLAALVLAFHHP